MKSKKTSNVSVLLMVLSFAACKTGSPKHSELEAFGESITLSGSVVAYDGLTTGNGDLSFEAVSLTSGRSYTVSLIGSPSSSNDPSTIISNCDVDWLQPGKTFSLTGTRSGSSIIARTVNCGSSSNSNTVNSSVPTTLDGVVISYDGFSTGNGDLNFQAQSNTSGNFFTVFLVGSPRTGDDPSTVFSNCAPGWIAPGRRFNLVGKKNGSDIIAQSVRCK
jgi:hypothetical protein